MEGRTKAARRKRAGSVARDSGAFVRLPIIGGLMRRGADLSARLYTACRCPSCELRYERVVGLCFGLRCLPGGAEEREQEAVESEIPGGLPGEDEHDGQNEQDRVTAGAASEHEVHVHEGASDGGDAHERSDDQADADSGLAEGNDLAHEDLGVVVDEELDEAAVPVVKDHGLGGCGGDR